MQPCNRIYYSTVHWQLNMFRAGYRSSSGARTVFVASGLHTHVVTGRNQVRPDYGRSPRAYVNQRLQIQFELLMMSGMPLETCWAVNELWNNKFCYKVASCWLFLLSHTTMHGSMNIKCNYSVFDMFPTSKWSSSGRLVLAVLWYFFHASIEAAWSMAGCASVVICVVLCIVCV